MEISPATSKKSLKVTRNVFGNMCCIMLYNFYLKTEKATLERETFFFGYEILFGKDAFVSVCIFLSFFRTISRKREKKKQQEILAEVIEEDHHKVSWKKVNGKVVKFLS